MFDKLIESTSDEANFRSRRSYFMVSSFVVGALFVTAVVISIYAADIGLGHDSLELVEMIAPVEPAPVEPETPQPPAATSQSQTKVATRQADMSNVNEPTIVPTTTSTTPNTQMSRPETGRYIIADFYTNPGNSGNSGRETPGTGLGDGGITPASQIAENMTVPEPPPVKAPPVKPVVSGGVVNGKATYLPVPSFPAAAKAVGAFGKVDVQVLIDESGKVVSANAVSGHPLLRSAAEQAARGAKFSPTYLTKVAVKVTGVIVYNFNRN